MLLWSRPAPLVLLCVLKEQRRLLSVGIALCAAGATAVTFGETVLLFGGYNGRYLNDVLVLRLVQDADWAQGVAQVMGEGGEG